MTFNFPTLVAHAARTRPLGAGTIIGSGTVSNYDRSAGSSCLAEKRMLEVIEHGEAKTPFLKFGDRVRIVVLKASLEERKIDFRLVEDDEGLKPSPARGQPVKRSERSKRKY